MFESNNMLWCLRVLFLSCLCLIYVCLNAYTRLYVYRQRHPRVYNTTCEECPFREILYLTRKIEGSRISLRNAKRLCLSNRKIEFEANC